EGTRDLLGHRFWNATEACCNANNSTVDDVAYLKAIIDGVRREFNVDVKRIYLIGHSNGGFMAYRMAAEHADVIAAIVSIGGASSLSFVKPISPVNILHIHGTADSIVTFNNGSAIPVPSMPPITFQVPYPGAVASIDQWLLFNGGASRTTESTRTLDLDLNVAGLDTVVTRGVGSAAGGAVELWAIQGGGHFPLAKRGTEQSQLAAKAVEWLLDHPKP
ncbi:MAG: alpha/beta fold hydrolase, partial [Verrucomicrobiota bacterium]